MICQNVSRLLVAYLDGEATAEECFEIEAHLAICAPCRSELAGTIEVQRKFRNAVEAMAKSASASPKAWNAIRRAVESDSWAGRIGLLRPLLDKAASRLRGMVSGRPAWKLGMGSILAVAGVVALAAAISWVASDAPTAVAAQIAQDDPQVREALGSDSQPLVLVAEVVEGTGNVLVRGSTSSLIMVMASVDLNLRQVTRVERLEPLSMPQLTDAERLQVARIAHEAPDLRNPAIEGAHFGKAFIPFAAQGKTSIEANVGLTPSSNIAALEVRKGERTWLVYLDLDRETVEKVLELQCWLPPFHPSLKPS